MGLFNPLRWGIRVKRKYSREECVERAIEEYENRNGGSEYWGYHLGQNNCEHFATWIVTGNKYSVQTDRSRSLFLSDVFGYRGTAQALQFQD